MHEIDRMAAVIRPTPAFVNWVNEHCQTLEEKITLEDVQNDCTVLLVPVFDDSVEAENYIESLYLEIFENELSAWSLDEESWPPHRSYELFQQLFYIEFHSFVYDTASKHDEFIEIPATIQ